MTNHLVSRLTIVNNDQWPILLDNSLTTLAGLELEVCSHPLLAKFAKVCKTRPLHTRYVCIKPNATSDYEIYFSALSVKGRYHTGEGQKDKDLRKDSIVWAVK